MRKAEVVVLIILFSSFAYLGIMADGGRGKIIAVVTAIVFGAVAYGSYLQEKMYRKARRPGTSIFAPQTMLRAVRTREFVYFILLGLVTIAFAGIIVAMDGWGYFR